MRLDELKKIEKTRKKEKLSLSCEEDADAIMSLMEESGMSETEAEKTIRNFVRDGGLKQSWIEG